MTAAALAALAALAGLAIALFFALADRGRIAPDTRILPAFCRLDERRCGTVLRHPHARLLGVPNYAPGIVYYLVVLAAGILPLPDAAATALQVLSWCVVAAGVFLTWSLFAVIRVRCPLCLSAHAINVILALILSL